MIKMGNLIEIKKRIESVSSTIKVTKVMQMIATSKIAKIKQMIVVVDKYEKSFDDIFNLFIKNTENLSDIKSYFGFNQKAKNSVLLFVISSDKGTCGSINTNIFKELSSVIREYKNNGKNVIICPIGKKICKHIQTNVEKLGIEVYETENYLEAEYCDAKIFANLVNNALKMYDNGEINEISVLYHNFKNIITCNAIKRQLLPIISYEFNSLIKTKSDDFINIEETANTLPSVVEYYLKNKLYKVYVLNLASIISSRMNSMDNATKNGQEIIDNLRIQYNKGRQAKITSELSDIVSGFEAIS